MLKEKINLKLSPSLLRRMRKAASKEGRTNSSWVEQLVKEALKSR